MLGIGYEDVLDDFISMLPSSCRRILLSATLGEDVDLLKDKFLSKPVRL